MDHRPKYKIQNNKTLFPVGKVNVGGPSKVGVGSLSKSHCTSALELHPDSLSCWANLKRLSLKE